MTEIDQRESAKRFSVEMRKNNRWMVYGLCAASPYRDFNWFPTKDEYSPMARQRHNNTLNQICNACPVKLTCHTFARTAGVTAGFWAGHYYGA